MRRLILGAILAFTPSAALADETVGSWCWRMAPINDSMNASIVISKTGSGDYVMKQTFYDGSKREVALQATGSQRYLYKDNEFGDGVEIRPDGLLQMFDSEGALEIARPRSTNQCIKK